MIAIDAVYKSFDGLNVVRDLSLTVDDGEVFGLAGPNGAGKTTTIKLMTGLLKPDSGTILIGKKNIVTEPMSTKKIFGYVPDKAFLYEKLSVREFLTFCAALHHVGKPDAIVRIEKFIDIFGLKDNVNELIEGLSQGTRQRLLFAAALIHNPDILIIDEPFVGLDPFGVRIVKDVIKELSAKGVTVFLATHSLHIAEELCRRVGFIRRGALVSVKTREEIMEVEGGLEGLFMKISG